MKELIDFSSLDEAFGTPPIAPVLVDWDECCIEIHAGTSAFDGYTHTEEAKKRISEKTKGENNPRYGVKVKGTALAQKISEANKGKFVGADNPNAKTYTLTSPDGTTYSVCGGLKSFCKEHGLSYATMHAAITYNRTTPRRNGWSIVRL